MRTPLQASKEVAAARPPSGPVAPPPSMQPVGGARKDSVTSPRLRPDM